MSKMTELRKLEIGELRGRREEALKSVAKQNLEQAGSKSKDLHLGKKARHEIARISLVISEKELIS